MLKRPHAVICACVSESVKHRPRLWEKKKRQDSLCKRKGYIIGVVGPDDFKLTKGENLLKLYQFHDLVFQNKFFQSYFYYYFLNWGKDIFLIV